jgi:hypothetical protein
MYIYRQAVARSFKTLLQWKHQQCVVFVLISLKNGKIVSAAQNKKRFDG